MEEEQRQSSGQVDIDREVQAQGMMNVVSAMLCGLSINLISSYSFAAMKLGGGGWVFYLAQAVGSVLPPPLPRTSPEPREAST